MEWLWIVLLVALGFALVLAELFIPSAGLITLLATGVFIVAVAVAFNHSVTTGIVVLIVLAVGLPVTIVVGLNLWAKSPFGKAFILQAPKPEEVTEQNPRERELQELVGRIGTAVTPLRPAGIIDLDGRRFDTVADGVMVDPGTRVKVVRVDGFSLVVRPIEPTSQGSDPSA